MKKIITVAFLLTACASAPMPPQKKTESVGQTIARDPENFRTGIFADNKSGKNLYIIVENLKSTELDNEKKLNKLERELDYWRRQNEAMTSQNNTMRVNINQKMENEVMQDIKTLPPAPAEKVVNEAAPTYPERYENHGGIKGYQASPEPREVVQFRDPYRMSNEGSVPPGIGTKPLYPNNSSVDVVEAPKAEPLKMPKIENQPTAKATEPVAKVENPTTPTVDSAIEAPKSTPANIASKADAMAKQPAEKVAGKSDSVSKTPKSNNAPIAQDANPAPKTAKADTPSPVQNAEPVAKADRTPASGAADLPKPVTEEGL